MPEITAELVKKLREETNVSMMECKKALVEANGDIAQATLLLRKRGMSVAANKASRAANQGLIASATADNGKTVSLVEVNCETNFVARNETFKAFIQTLAERASATDDNLAETMKNDITAKVAEIGENIVLRHNIRYVLSGTGSIASYIHLGGKVGAMVEVACEKSDTVTKDAFKELVKDLTLQIAAANPKHLTPAEVPADVIAAEREVYASQVKDKPPQIVGKIVDGKLKKFFSEICLVDQIFVKESKTTITALLDARGKELNDKLAIRRFVRYQIGK